MAGVLGLLDLVAGFSPQFTGHQPISARALRIIPTTSSPPRTIGKRTLPPLKYRELDDDDPETVGITVQTRTPPGFSTKDALKLQLQEQTPRSGVNVPLVRAILLNQILILALASAVAAVLLTITNGGFDWMTYASNIFDWTGKGNEVDLFDFTITTSRLGTGVLGAIPVIVLGSAIERSDKREFANVNFSTIIMVMTLFGRRTKPKPEFLPPRLRNKRVPVTSLYDVFIRSFVIASLTGFCEELVFRRIVASLIYRFTGGDIIAALFGQATLFGLGHATNGTSSMENGIVTSLQAVNGLWFGTFYLLSGGDIVTCIIAHAIYDLQVFFFTWLGANEQIEYAESKYLEPFDSETTRELQQVRAPRDIVQKCKKLFFTFDYDKNATISLSEIRKGIAYLALEKSTAAPPQSAIDAAFKKYSEPGSDRLTFGQFLNLFVALTV